ncbi:alpha/beta fold hydrolase [Subtercola sp. YIM 133946]|uniref:alpha/beta fold hydrolase n=1 Tax=Subtercola sp. YIM 133946 TaxID=3118909 RepID=UPI002F95354A
MTGLTTRVAAWAATGGYETVDAHQIFVRRSGGDGPLVVLLHGYPSSSYDWRGVLPALEATGASVLAFDFLGFGLSDKPTDVVYSLKMQADIAEQLIAGRPALIIAHDLGDSVATELMARDIDGALTFALNGVMITNGSVIIGEANLTAAQKLLRGRLGPLVARLISEKVIRKQLAGAFSTAHPFTEEEGDDQWSLLSHNGGDTIIDKLSYFNRERVEFAHRWEGAIRDWSGRLTVGWGVQDRISGEPVLEAIISLDPQVHVTRWPDLGHFPQVEDASTVSRLAVTFATSTVTGEHSDT